MQLILPTLWRPPPLPATLAAYLEHGTVERVIVIDNEPRSRPDLGPLPGHRRLLLLPQERNLFVNPAWNLGIALVDDPGALVGILNDDIRLSSEALDRIGAHPWQSGDVLGLLPDDPPDSLSPSIEPIPYRKDLSIGRQYLGFGSALFLRRVDFRPIPADLSIWFGDDWILQGARRVLGLRDGGILREHHRTMRELRHSEDFRRRLANDRAAAQVLLGLQA